MKKGFIILTILLILIGIVLVFGTRPICTATNQSRTLSNIDSLKLAIASYYMDHGTIPKEGELSSALKADSYIDSPSQLKDGWGEEIIYRIIEYNDKTYFYFLSYGSDGIPGGDEYDADLIIPGFGSRQERYGDEK